MLFHKDSPQPAGPRQDLANLKVTDARVGDNLSLAGAAADFTDLDFTVDRHAVLEAGERQWTELSGMYRDHRVFLDIYNEDDVEVFATIDPRRITLDELGVSEDDLAAMDERQNPADFFDFEKKFWLFRWSHEAGVFRDEQGSGKGYYMWRFQEQDGPRFLTIKKPEAEPFTGTIANKINPQDITVYRGT